MHRQFSKRFERSGTRITCMTNKANLKFCSRCVAGVEVAVPLLRPCTSSSSVSRRQLVSATPTCFHLAITTMQLDTVWCCCAALSSDFATYWTSSWSVFGRVKNLHHAAGYRARMFMQWAFNVCSMLHAFDTLLEFFGNGIAITMQDNLTPPILECARKPSGNLRSILTVKISQDLQVFTSRSSSAWNLVPIKNT